MSREPSGQRSCKKCGRTIGFVRNPELNGYHVVDVGKLHVIVTADGVVARGWTSHYATCPGAAEVRSEQADKRQAEQGRLSFLKPDQDRDEP